jgi:pimeloyl-ACP methyl ester carboxylesterase
MHAAKLVRVDGARRMNLYCIGSGSPTVLFDSGLSTSMRTWRLVQGEIAKTTRACAYDRAGIGFSDPRTGESDAHAIVTDLHALLGAARIKTPILYVGHSIAGLYGVLLAATHPNDVAGAVLVDPSFADQFFAMTGAAIAAGAPPQAADTLLASLHAMSRHARECATAPTPLPDDCFDVPKDLSPALTQALKEQQSRPSYQLADASENDSFLPLTVKEKSADQIQLEAVTPGFGDKPLVVLTSSKPIMGASLKPEWSAAVDQAWKAGHDKLATLSTRGSNTVVQGSGHTIQHDQPQAVIDAVKKALAEIRAR